MEVPETYEDSLLTVARAYAEAAAGQRGKSLARVATIVANRGSFFDALERGATCSVRNYEKFATYFGNPANWPGGVIPETASSALQSIGRPAFDVAVCSTCDRRLDHPACRVCTLAGCPLVREAA